LAAAVALLAAAPATASPSLAPTPARADVAHMVMPTVVRSRPGSGTVRWRTPDQTDWAGGPVNLLVLGSKVVAGTQWLHVRLPVRPNDSAGWIKANYAELSVTRWRVVVHTAARRVDVYRSGRLVRSFSAVVGKPSTPTPHGLFAVWDKVRESDPTGFLGPWALHLTAHSNVLMNFGGGPGRVAIHGRAGSSLRDPLGSADSHGCIRVLNANIIWLAGVLGSGDPVLVTS
jgi:lipoprotein-anchoring transpeptidase ErfK/SrfK